MKKVKQLRGFVIGQGQDLTSNASYDFHVYTADEWAYGSGLRYADWDCDSIAEAVEWIGSENAR